GPGNFLHSLLRPALAGHLQRLSLDDAAKRQRLILAEPLPHGRDQHFPFRRLDRRFLAELRHDLAEAVHGEALLLAAEEQFLAVLVAFRRRPVQMADPFAFDGRDEPVIEEELAVFFLSRAWRRLRGDRRIAWSNFGRGWIGRCGLRARPDD